MVNYYYARQEKEENGVKYLEVPMMVNPETAKENGQHFYMEKICGRKFPCIYVWIPESYYEMHKRDLENQAKADERSDRCLIPDPKKPGGRIRCPEKNRCISCPFVGTCNFDNGHDTSLDALMEAGFDAETGVEQESEYDFASAAATPEQIVESHDMMHHLDETLDIVVSLLEKKKPKYGMIFSELRNGETNASEIARRHGLKANRTAEDIPKVQALARELYINIK